MYIHYSWRQEPQQAREENHEWHEAMRSNFTDKWWKAVIEEIRTLKEMNLWEVVEQEPSMNIIGAIWAFKPKIFPDGLIKKFKARFCARGNQQNGAMDNY